MSDSGDNNTDTNGLAFGELAEVIERLLERFAETSDRAAEAQARVTELETRIEARAADGTDPVALKSMVSELEARNSDLTERIIEGREGVERLLSRLRFLEDRR